MSSQEIKPEPLAEVEGAFEHLNERAEDFSNIVFDYEDPDQDKILIKEEIKEEIKHEPMDIDNRDDDSHVIDVEKDQEKSYLQSMIDKLLIEKHTLQKDIDKLVELQVENQILKSEKSNVERQLEDKTKEFEELQVKNQNLTDLINNSKKLNKSDITQNMEISELNEEEPTVFQAEEFNISDPMASSNCSDSGTTQITFEQSTIPYSDNDSPEENKKKEEAWLHLTDTSDGEEDEDHFNKKSKSKEHFTINRKRMPRSTRKDIRYDKDESSHDDNISNMDNSHQNRRHILKKTNSKVTPHKKNQVKIKQDHRRPIKTVHGKQKTYKCEICGQAFRQKQNIKTHIKTVHEKHRDYNCKICGKDFTAKQILNRHINTVHEKRRDYKCEICGQSFGQNGTLITHIKIVHENLRDYNCKICGKDFGEKSNLNVHIKTVHTKQKDYKCQYCSKSFPRKCYRERHERKIHNIM